MEQAEEGGGVRRRWASGEQVGMVRKLKVKFIETGCKAFLSGAIVNVLEMGNVAPEL